MENCIFCDIVNDKIAGHKIRENEKFLAILDVFPNRKGMTLVISKEHYHSDPTNVDTSIMQAWIQAVQEVMQLLKEKLWVPRVWLVIEGLEIDHLHFKLYPFWENVWFPNGVWSGPQANNKELEDLEKKIIG